MRAVTLSRTCEPDASWIRTYLVDELNPYIVYHYTPDRMRAGPTGWLTDYKGHLQADA